MSWWVVHFHETFGVNFGGLTIPGISPPQEHLTSVQQANSPNDAENQLKQTLSGAVIDGVQGPYATQAAAEAAQGPQQIGVTSPAGAAQAVAGSISQSVLGPLFQANIWLRAGEIVIGILLVGIGLNAMLKGKPFQVITAPVGALGKIIP